MVSYTKMTDVIGKSRSDAKAPTRAYDTALLFAVLALVGIGVVMVYSASVYVAEVSKGDGAYYLKRQLLNAGIALAALGAGLSLHYRRLRQLVYPILLASLALLAILLVPGIGATAGRSTRWFQAFGFSFQPSEMAKLAFIIYLAYSLEKKNEKIRTFAVGFLPHLLVCAVIMLLALAQPDLGTCIVLAIVLVGMLFVAGTRVSYIVALTLLAIPVLFKLIAGNSMRMQRMLAFLDPWEHRYDSAFQIANALAAIGSGGLTGLGLGASRQKIGYVPEAQTDFILPIIGEELGFIGVVVVVGLMGFVVMRGLAIAWKAKDDFGRYLAFGITLLIGVQAVINMGVAVALLPTKGLTLPFISYGGTSLIVTCFSVGVLLNISRHNELEHEPEPPPKKPKLKTLTVKRPIIQRDRPVTEVLG